ncbi:MAG: hypothetical protein GX601_17220 [Anaerolineales bacterium]|nr:hypothetical protein [Anaerolineales bacterium]
MDAIYRYRVLRRDQAQQLFFPSKNTANQRLKLLHQHGFLARRRLPVEYGQGSGQALYLLGGRGAALVAAQLGVDVAEIGWRRTHNHVSSPFLEHTLMVNDIRLAVEAAASQQGYRIEAWLREEELKVAPDRVWVETRSRQRRRIAVVPDAHFRLSMTGHRACFFLEADRATETQGCWAQKIRAYLAYIHSGAYLRRYGSRSLRILTVTTGEKRMANLVRTTAQTCRSRDQGLFWFTSVEQVAQDTVLNAPVWRVNGEEGLMHLTTPDPEARRFAQPSPILTTQPCGVEPHVLHQPSTQLRNAP